MVTFSRYVSHLYRYTIKDYQTIDYAYCIDKYFLYLVSNEVIDMSFLGDEDKEMYKQSIASRLKKLDR